MICSRPWSLLCLILLRCIEQIRPLLCQACWLAGFAAGSHLHHMYLVLVNALQFLSLVLDPAAPCFSILTPNSSPSSLVSVLGFFLSLPRSVLVICTVPSKQGSSYIYVNRFHSIVATPTPLKHRQYNVTRLNALSLYLTNSFVWYPIVRLCEDATEPFHLY